MPSELSDIPEFLRIPQEERKAAWDKFRLAQKPIPAKLMLPEYKRITDLPGAAPHDDTNDT